MSKLLKSTYIKMEGLKSQLSVLKSEFAKQVVEASIYKPGNKYPIPDIMLESCLFKRGDEILIDRLNFTTEEDGQSVQIRISVTGRFVRGDLVDEYSIPYVHLTHYVVL